MITAEPENGNPLPEPLPPELETYTVTPVVLNEDSWNEPLKLM